MTTAQRGVPSTVRSEGGLLSAQLLARVADTAGELAGLAPSDYHLAPGERTRQAIDRSWARLVEAWKSFTAALFELPASDATAMSLTRERWLLVLFDELGYGRLQSSRALVIDGATFPISHSWSQVPIHLVGARLPIDRRTPGVRGAAGASPHSLVQELLNRSTDHLWGIVSNGLQLRLLRDNASLARQAFVEFDLETMMAGELFGDFAVLWLCCHESRLEGDPATCWLERWHAESAVLGIRALDSLRTGVTRAIGVLGVGFISHPTNAALRQQLRSGALSPTDLYRQLLRLVYRFIFILVAEDRGVLLDPDAATVAKERYAAYYSVGRLRPLSRCRRSGAHCDLWQAMSVVFGALGSHDGQPLLGLPSLGSFLWSAGATSDLGGATLANRFLLAAVEALAFTADGTVRRPVDFSNLGSEELGSVYESLLELHPDMDADAGTFTLTSAAGNERKTTGSYYTPTSLIASLLDSALDPVIDEAVRAADPEAAILGLRVLDPACGSGHFLVAAAHRIARRLASVRTGEEQPGPDDVRHALRDVVGHCIFGVDLNPMAVELCKVSLWLEEIEPGRPLSFLDHHIVCGNSLVGATPELVAGGIPDDAYRALSGDDKTVVASAKKRNKAERAGVSELPLWATAAPGDTLAAAMVALDSIPDVQPDDITEKEGRWRSLVASDAMVRGTFAADAWCAAFVAPKDAGMPVITSGVVRRAGEGGPGAVDPEVVALVRAMAAEYRFCHLHLVFPQVFDTDPGTGPGGFDVVLGNPPWEKVKLSEKEFFATRDPEIAAAAGAARKRKVSDLAATDPALFAAYRDALRHAEAESAVLRSSGRFPLTGRGDVNTYAVFAELMRSAMGPTGRCGAIVPSGIATDDTTKAFFADLVEAASLVSLYDFENSGGVFPGVHRSYKFCLLTLSGGERPVEVADFAFFCQGTGDLADEGRRFTLGADELSLVNPNTRTCPIFRSRRDAELTLAAYRRVPVLVAEGPPEANPWGIRFSRLFDMTNDSGLFRTAAQCEGDGSTLSGNAYRHPDGRTWLPLYEGKMVHHFDHRAADVVISTTALVRQGQPDYLDVTAHADPKRLPSPRSWVISDEIDRRLPDDRSWLLGFCDITSATNERTMLAAVIPRSAVGNKLPLLLAEAPPARAVLLGASLASFVFDYLARQKVGGVTLNFFIVKQLPVLPPATYDRPCPWDPERSVADWLTPRVLELTYTATDLTGFARDLGWDGPPFRWDPERRAVLRAELDACFFHLYGFERDDVAYVMDTFPIVRRKDQAAYGEYRTARMILDAFDALAHAAGLGAPYPYPSPLTPPPGSRP